MYRGGGEGAGRAVTGAERRTGAEAGRAGTWAVIITRAEGGAGRAVTEAELITGVEEVGEWIRRMREYEIF